MQYDAGQRFILRRLGVRTYSRPDVMRKARKKQKEDGALTLAQALRAVPLPKRPGNRALPDGVRKAIGRAWIFYSAEVPWKGAQRTLVAVNG